LKRACHRDYDYLEWIARLNDVMRKPFIVEQLEASLKRMFRQTHGGVSPEEDLVR
jgi:hypothetical protein